MELYEPLSLRAFEVTAFAFTLPGLRFPVDLSGGVAQFRHRRGELQHLVFRANPSAIAEQVEPHASAVLGTLKRPVNAWLRPAGLSIGAVGEGPAFRLTRFSEARHRESTQGHSPAVPIGSQRHCPPLGRAQSTASSLARSGWPISAMRLPASRMVTKRKVPSPKERRNSRVWLRGRWRLEIPCLRR